MSAPTGTAAEQERRSLDLIARIARAIVDRGLGSDATRRGAALARIVSETGWPERTARLAFDAELYRAELIAKGFEGEILAAALDLYRERIRTGAPTPTLEEFERMRSAGCGDGLPAPRDPPAPTETAPTHASDMCATCGVCRRPTRWFRAAHPGSAWTCPRCHPPAGPESRYLWCDSPPHEPDPIPEPPARKPPASSRLSRR